ncbi:MAG TPA: hypothetical protein PL163_23475, partial [Leptospiraceae bacterium]|nr:hypothetical protein [Leptospiraceae bacterium]
KGSTFPFSVILMQIKSSLLTEKQIIKEFTENSLDLLSCGFDSEYCRFRRSSHRKSYKTV